MQPTKIPARRPLPARRPPARSSASIAPPPEPSFCAEAEEVDFDDVLGTSMFDTLARVRALPVPKEQCSIAAKDLRQTRGYTPDELYALAEIAYHYLFSGGHRIAQTIFEGLAAIAPDEPYFQLALGLSFDRLNRLKEARAAYERAARLDPADPRAEINLAELMMGEAELASARQRLSRAIQKAHASQDRALLAKAKALVAQLPEEV